ncbi:Hypothetical protein SCLAV_4948 [Streptomyces clavuligerus]|uniref:Uncharacterized protein n=1 Tax=Streptomyces clavuligerus TaxID=1901 RepID=E2PW31_STRCL|nr:Hypothetical protein SCLAV_4948 [Streptomyces clavuligerus]
MLTGRGHDGRATVRPVARAPPPGAVPDVGPEVCPRTDGPERPVPDLRPRTDGPGDA